MPPRCRTVRAVGTRAGDGGDNVVDEVGFSWWPGHCLEADDANQPLAIGQQQFPQGGNRAQHADHPFRITVHRDISKEGSHSVTCRLSGDFGWPPRRSRRGEICSPGRLTRNIHVVAGEALKGRKNVAGSPQSSPARDQPFCFIPGEEGPGWGMTHQDDCVRIPPCAPRRAPNKEASRRYPSRQGIARGRERGVAVTWPRFSSDWPGSSPGSW